MKGEKNNIDTSYYAYQWTRESIFQIIYIYISKASRDKYIPTKNQYLANNIIKHLKVCGDIQWGNSSTVSHLRFQNDQV